MPRYRFHVFNDDQTTDHDGKVFPNSVAARSYAISCARGIMADELKTSGKLNLSHWIEVEDDDGEMQVVTFGEAVTIDNSTPGRNSPG